MIGTYRFLGPSGFGTYHVDLATGAAEPSADAAETLLVPGFVDIHIHGAFGIDFMNAAGPHALIELCGKLSEAGYEAFLATTVTASPEAVATALGNIPDHPMIAGIHLEGPFISPVFPGAQPKAFIADLAKPDPHWQPILADPRLRLITIAPEIPGALKQIRELSDRGVVCSMGHTNATFAEAQAGFEAGATHTTHTFNAMRPLHHRQAGTLGFALTCNDLSCEIIYDRHHVCKEAAAILIKNKPVERLIAVSDGTMAAGLPSGSEIEMWNLETIVQGGTVRLKDGTLAGSAITLLDAFRNLYEDFGPETAIRACCINPRRDLGLERVRSWNEFSPELELIARHEAR